MKKIIATLFLSLAPVMLAQTDEQAKRDAARIAKAQPDRSKLEAVSEEIAAFEKAHPRKYVAGVISEVTASPEDGTPAYVLCQKQNGRCDRFDRWLIVAHPKRGMERNPEGAGGIGTTSDGRSYYGYAWFKTTIKDAVFVGGTGCPADLYDTTPSEEVAKLYAERDHLRKAIAAQGNDPDADAKKQAVDARQMKQATEAAFAETKIFAGRVLRVATTGAIQLDANTGQIVLGLDTRHSGWPPNENIEVRSLSMNTYADGSVEGWRKLEGKTVTVKAYKCRSSSGDWCLLDLTVE